MMTSAPATRSGDYETFPIDEKQRRHQKRKRLKQQDVPITIVEDNPLLLSNAAADAREETLQRHNQHHQRLRESISSKIQALNDLHKQQIDKTARLFRALKGDHSDLSSSSDAEDDSIPRSSSRQGKALVAKCFNVFKFCAILTLCTTGILFAIFITYEIVVGMQISSFVTQCVEVHKCNTSAIACQILRERYSSYYYKHTCFNQRLLGRIHKLVRAAEAKERQHKNSSTTTTTTGHPPPSLNKEQN